MQSLAHASAAHARLRLQAGCRIQTRYGVQTLQMKRRPSLSPSLSLSVMARRRSRLKGVYQIILHDLVHIPSRPAYLHKTEPVPSIVRKRIIIYQRFTQSGGWSWLLLTCTVRQKNR